jgi:maleylpyruvate isomerase
MKLYGYWRSSCTWRVRIALHYKGLPFDYVPVHLVKDGGEQFFPQYKERNAMSQVPVLEIDNNGESIHMSQSIAIMEFIDELFPENPILPRSGFKRAYARQLAELINSGIQPIQNLAVLKHVTQLGADKMEWGRHWIQEGLLALENTIKSGPKTHFLVSETPSIADFCLIPQLYNARRFKCDLTKLPLLTAIEANCEELSAFQKSHPDQQIDSQ